MELLEQIEDYWTDRAEGYSQVNQEELDKLETGTGTSFSGKQNK